MNTYHHIIRIYTYEETIFPKPLCLPYTSDLPNDLTGTKSSSLGSPRHAAKAADQLTDPSEGFHLGLKKKA